LFMVSEDNDRNDFFNNDFEWYHDIESSIVDILADHIWLVKICH